MGGGAMEICFAAGWACRIEGTAKAMVVTIGAIVAANLE